MKRPPKPEWSVPIMVADLGHAPATYPIVADADTRAALAERFDVIAIDDLSARLVLTRERGGVLIHVTGTVTGRVTQSCVVSGVPVITAIDEAIDAFFAEGDRVVSFAQAKATRGAADHEVEMLEERDSPEPIQGGAIDLGEVAAQFFSLAIPAYPRDPGLPPLQVVVGDDVGATGPNQGDQDDHAPRADSPFAALKAWRDQLRVKESE
jgi:uncharacterized metal-binding protein YceD (DUF177 family)